MKLAMDKYYGKQIIGFNEENKRFIKLEADWILNIKDNEELGKQVRNKMLEKIKELDEHTEQIKKQIEL
jgi:hypothetical protein